MANLGIVANPTIPADEVAWRRRVGTRTGKPLYAVATVGGLHVVADGDGEILGVGTHPAVARHLARRQPGVVLDGLAKSHDPDPRDFADLLPQAEIWTRQAADPAVRAALRAALAGYRE